MDRNKTTELYGKKKNTKIDLIDGTAVRQIVGENVSEARSLKGMTDIYNEDKQAEHKFSRKTFER